MNSSLDKCYLFRFVSKNKKTCFNFLPLSEIRHSYLRCPTSNRCTMPVNYRWSYSGCPTLYSRMSYSKYLTTNSRVFYSEYPTPYNWAPYSVYECLTSYRIPYGARLRIKTLHQSVHEEIGFSILMKFQIERYIEEAYHISDRIIHHTSKHSLFQ